MAATLYDLIPRNAQFSNDVLLERFLEYVEGRQLQLYPAQESYLGVEAVFQKFSRVVGA